MVMNGVEKCRNPELLAVLRRLKRYEKYCNLVSGDLGTYVKTFEGIGKMPEQLKEWLKLFDGGLLLTVSMFSTREKAPAQFNRILTFAEVNSPEFKKANGIYPDVVAFAMTSYGNYYCFIAGENSEAVYEWDAEKCALTVKWDSFAQWLSEQIDLGEELIQDDLLDPVED